MPAPQTRAFQLDAFQDEAPPSLAFQRNTFQTDDLFVSTPISGVGAISSAEAFGTPGVVRINAKAGAITSAEVFGTSKLKRILGLLGISSAEAFGRLTETGGSVGFDPSIIESREAFGVEVAVRILAAPGISSAEAFGAPVVSGGIQAPPAPGIGGSSSGAAVPAAAPPAPAAPTRQVTVTLVAGAKRLVVFNRRV